MEQAQVKELLLQSLEHERGGIQVYETALKCVVNEDLKEEWEKYLDQTQNHERILVKLMQQLSLDAEEDSPGRRIVKQLGGALVQAMETARGAEEIRPPQSSVPARCVVLAGDEGPLGFLGAHLEMCREIQGQGSYRPQGSGRRGRRARG